MDPKGFEPLTPAV